MIFWIIVIKVRNKDELVNCIHKTIYFLNLVVKVDSDKLIVFSYSEWHFKWLVMPFGLKNAPLVFQARMHKILKPYSKFCIVHIDDILVFSQNRFMHITHLYIIYI